MRVSAGSLLVFYSDIVSCNQTKSKTLVRNNFLQQSCSELVALQSQTTPSDASLFVSIANCTSTFNARHFASFGIGVTQPINNALTAVLILIDAASAAHRLHRSTSPSARLHWYSQSSLRYADSNPARSTRCPSWTVPTSVRIKTVEMNPTKQRRTREREGNASLWSNHLTILRSSGCAAVCDTAQRLSSKARSNMFEFFAKIEFV